MGIQYTELNIPTEICGPFREISQHMRFIPAFVAKWGQILNFDIEYLNTWTRVNAILTVLQKSQVFEIRWNYDQRTKYMQSGG